MELIPTRKTALPKAAPREAAPPCNFNPHAALFGESAEEASIEAWSSAFRESVADIPQLKGCHYTESAERLRRMIKQGAFKLSDLQRNPQRFFAAHRVLSEHATKVGPGFGIRMTVQYNLFAGTILALGNEEQVAALDSYQKEGCLGCFALTEKLAGVNSGLVVNTTATWEPETSRFRVHCVDEGAQKNWISQGCTAELAVCIADLVVNGVSHGPHGFLMRLRDTHNGELVPGVQIGDMGGKSIGNDLDNAWISFDNVMLPKTALLNRYSDIDERGQYRQTVEGVRNIDMIGQRLYTGRTVIASSTLVFARTLYAKTRAYSDNKKCWSPKGEVALSSIPQLQALYVEADAKLVRLFSFMHQIEGALGEHLQSGAQLTPPALVDAISAAKVKCIETAIDLCFRLKQEVGSYALMDGTGFSNLDYLQCCKFAEGDSRILMQKIARDRLSAFKRQMKAPAMEPSGCDFTPESADFHCSKAQREEARLCTDIGLAMMSKGFDGWNEKWEQVYALANTVIERTLTSWEDGQQLRGGDRGSRL